MTDCDYQPGRSLEDGGESSIWWVLPSRERNGPGMEEVSRVAQVGADFRSAFEGGVVLAFLPPVILL